MTAQQGNSNNNSADADADAAAGGANGGGGGGDAPSPQKQQQPNPAVEVILARLLTDTLTSLTREFEKDALMSGEVRTERGAEEQRARSVGKNMGGKTEACILSKYQ